MLPAEAGMFVLHLLGDGGKLASFSHLLAPAPADPAPSVPAPVARQHSTPVAVADADVAGQEVFAALRGTEPRPGSKPRSRNKNSNPLTAAKRTSLFRGVTRHRWTGKFEAHLWDSTAARAGGGTRSRGKRALPPTHSPMLLC